MNHLSHIHSHPTARNTWIKLITHPLHPRPGPLPPLHAPVPEKLRLDSLPRASLGASTPSRRDGTPPTRLVPSSPTPPGCPDLQGPPPGCPGPRVPRQDALACERRRQDARPPPPGCHSPRACRGQDQGAPPSLGKRPAATVTRPDLGDLDLEADESVTVLMVVVRRGPVILTGRVASGDVDRRVGQGKGFSRKRASRKGSRGRRGGGGASWASDADARERALDLFPSVLRMSATSSYGICSTFLQGHGAHVPVRGRGSELLLLKRALWEDELGDVQEPMLERLPQRRAAVSSDEEEKRITSYPPHADDHVVHARATSMRSMCCSSLLGSATTTSNFFASSSLQGMH